MAKDNGISLNYAVNKSQGAGTLSAIVKVISGQPTLEYTRTSTNSGVTWYYLPKYSGWISKTAVDKLL